jgi:hypothetical protein
MSRARSPIARKLAGADGFTLVEVALASAVLLVGMLGVVAMLTGAIGARSSASARIGASNLARQLVETSRGLDYDELTPAQLVARMQARGLGSGTPWTIERRHVAYSITATACTYDSPADRLAASPPADVCMPQPVASTGDANGDDFRRVTVVLAWKDRGRTRSLAQSALLVNPSGGLGPRIASVAPLTQTITAPLTTHAITTFTSATAAAVHWHADDGHSEGDATAPVGSPQAWAADWALGVTGSGSEVLDGAYQIIAQAFDDRGVAGDAKLATVVVNRRKPYAPPSLAGGHDTRLALSDWVDLSWSLSSERDILGYRVYWAGPDLLAGNGNDVLVCPATAAAVLANSTSSCSDTSPSGLAALYYVVAVDRDAAGALREGDARPAPIVAPLTRPLAPRGPLVAARADGVLTLTWSPPLLGSPIFYRIYRDGLALADRVDRTNGAAATWSTAVDAATHEYWITAVDATYNESDAIGPVQ